MKRFYIILTLLLTGFFLACGGATSVKKTPEHLTAGMKATTKGISGYNKGCYYQALQYFFKAHELFSASDQRSGVAMSLNNIGNVYRIVGDRESAVLFFDESLRIYTELDDHSGIIQVLSNKAAFLIDGDQLKEAENVLDTADALAQKKGVFYGPLLNNRGILFTRTKAYPNAEKILNTSFSKTKPEDLAAFATVNFALGKLMQATERFEKAVDFFNAALDADRLAEFYKGMGDDLAAIGSVYASLGKNELAVDFFKRSIKIYALIKSEKNVRDILEQLENLAKKSGVDISVTTHFVGLWLEGKATETLCK